MRTGIKLAATFALCATTWLASGTTVLADETRIRNQVHDFLADLFSQDTHKLVIGPIEVGPAARGRHPVSVSGISARLGIDETDRDALRLALPQFALTAEPLTAERLRLTHVSMPDGLSILTSKGRRMGSLNAAAATASGTWAADLGSAIDVDIAMDQLRFAFDARDLRDDILIFAHADKAALRSVDSFDRAGLWTSKGSGRLAGLDMGTDKDGRLTLADLAFTATVGGLWPDAVLQFNRLSADPDAGVGDAWVEAILRDGLLDSLVLESTLTDMAITAADVPGTVTLSRIGQGLTLDKLRSDNATASLILSMEGLSVPQDMLPDSEGGRLLPTRVSLDLALHGVPGKELGEAASRLYAQDSLDLFEIEAQGILAAAPLELAVNAARLDAAGMSVLATGGLNVTPGARKGFTGKMEVTAHGLTEAMGELATLPPSEFKQNALTVLALFLGNAEPQKDGSMRALFEITRNGAITVNGRPLDLPK